VTEIPYLEQSEMDRKDYRPSKLLNYLDFSLDIELGDLFKSKKLEGLWLGVSIHHRSGIFESASAFGRIAGGSNINCIHLQYHW
jgi:outer membrane protein